MTHIFDVSMARPQPWDEPWRLSAMDHECRGDTVHWGDTGYIRRVGKIMGQAIYQIHRGIPGGVADGELVRGKAAALKLVEA